MRLPLVRFRLALVRFAARSTTTTTTTFGMVFLHHLHRLTLVHLFTIVSTTGSRTSAIGINDSVFDLLLGY
jgi:hypothetical protein